MDNNFNAAKDEKCANRAKIGVERTICNIKSKTTWIEKVDNLKERNPNPALYTDLIDSDCDDAAYIFKCNSDAVDEKNTGA
jgi:hypothetical protein